MSRHHRRQKRAQRASHTQQSLRMRVVHNPPSHSHGQTAPTAGPERYSTAMNVHALKPPPRQFTYDEFNAADPPAHYVDGSGKRLKQDGFGVANKIYWEAYFTSEPNTQDVCIVQRRLGYHPSGYGIGDIQGIQLEDGRWHVQWFCWASCD